MIILYQPLLFEEEGYNDKKSIEKFFPMSLFQREMNFEENMNFI